MKSWNPGQFFLDHVLIKWGQPLNRDKFFKEWFWFIKSRNGDNTVESSHNYVADDSEMLDATLNDPDLDLSEDFLETILKQVDKLCDNIKNSDYDIAHCT